MYRLPQDIINRIKIKYPGIENLEEIINYIFEEIREKSITDGSCSIHKFGSFYTYKSFSGRKGVYVPRFKFRPSRAFMDAMNSDFYIIRKIDKVMERIYDASKRTPEQKILRDVNFKSHEMILNNQRTIKEKIEENIVRDEISKILEESFEEK